MSAPTEEQAPDRPLPLLFLTVDEAAVVLRCGRTKCFALIRAKAFPSVKFGGQRLVRVADLEAYVAALEPDESPSEVFEQEAA